MMLETLSHGGWIGFFVVGGRRMVASVLDRDASFVLDREARRTKYEQSFRGNVNTTCYQLVATLVQLSTS